MKKYVLLGAILGLLFPTVSASATTVLDRQEKSEGVLKLSLTSDDTAYVTAFQVSLKVEGNASARLFEWSSNIKSSYTRKVVYHEDTAILDIIVATGNDDNLISKEGVIELGTLKFYENTSSNPRYYNVHFNTEKDNYLQFMNRGYDATIPSKVELNDEKTFVLNAKKPEIPKEDESDPGQSKDPTIYDPEDNQTSEKDPVKEGSDEGDKKDDNTEYFGKDDNKEKKDPVKEESTPIYYYLLPIGGLLIVGTFAFLVWKRK